MAAELIRHGVNVHVFNQRSIQDILSMIVILGAMVGCAQKASTWVHAMEKRIADIKEQSAKYPYKPTVYFEKWYDPVIPGIKWVSEIIDIAGGKDCYTELAKEKLAKNRIIDNCLDVVKDIRTLLSAHGAGVNFDLTRPYAAKDGKRCQLSLIDRSTK